MKILLSLLHPAHFLLFKGFILEMQKRKHEFIIVSRKKDCLIELLDYYGFKHECISEHKKGVWPLAKELMTRVSKIKKICKKEKPDILLGCMGADIVLIRNKLSYIVYDTEDSGIVSKYVYPLATKIITPECFAEDLGKKHVKYRGHKELAYLTDFKPEDVPINNFFFLRFVSWGASHDIGQSGLNLEYKRKIIEKLSKLGNIIISSEGQLPEEFEKYIYKDHPAKIHSYLYHARMFIGDSQTMATEAGLLGTPSIRCNTLVGTNHGKGVFEKLEEECLVKSVKNPEEVLLLIDELINKKNEWQIKAGRYFAKNENVTEWLVRYFDNIKL